MNTASLLVLVFAFILHSVCTAAVIEKPLRKFVTIGTGGVTAVFFLAGNTICRVLNKKRAQHSIRCTAESTAGTIYNLNNLRSGDMDLAIVQSDGQFYAWHGTGPFKEPGPDKNLRAVFSLHPESLTIVARQDANIKSFEQLRGKRINIGNPGSGQRSTMLELMKAMGWSNKDFSLSAELKSSEQAEALCDNKIDAFAFTVGHPNGSVREASSVCDTKLISVTGDKVTRLIRDRPYYRLQHIPAGLYRGTAAETITIGLTATVITSSKTDAEIIYQITRAVFDNLKTFRKLHPVFTSLDSKAMSTDGLTIPLHEGAKRYFREARLISE